MILHSPAAYGAIGRRVPLYLLQANSADARSIGRAQGFFTDSAIGRIYEVGNFICDTKKSLHGAYDNMAPALLSINKDIDLIKILL